LVGKDPLQERGRSDANIDQRLEQTLTQTSPKKSILSQVIDN